MDRIRNHETVSDSLNRTPGTVQAQPPRPINTQTLVVFDPNRQAIHMADRVFLLSLNLREDGTGLARLSEVAPGGEAAFLVCAFKQAPDQEWVFILNAWTGRGATPRAAVTECLRKRHGLPPLS